MADDPAFFHVHNTQFLQHLAPERELVDHPAFRAEALADYRPAAPCCSRIAPRRHSGALPACTCRTALTVCRSPPGRRGLIGGCLHRRRACAWWRPRRMGAPQHHAPGRRLHGALGCTDLAQHLVPTFRWASLSVELGAIVPVFLGEMALRIRAPCGRGSDDDRPASSPSP